MRLISTVHPTDNQKRVLAKIVASSTPATAAGQLVGDVNIVAARNMLMKLGMITYSRGEAALTDAGRQVASDEGIIDQSGQLTDQGQQLAYTNVQNAQDSDPAGQPVKTESFHVLKQILA